MSCLAHSSGRSAHALLCCLALSRCTPPDPPDPTGTTQGSSSTAVAGSSTGASSTGASSSTGESSTGASSTGASSTGASSTGASSTLPEDASSGSGDASSSGSTGTGDTGGESGSDGTGGDACVQNFELLQLASCYEKVDTPYVLVGSLQPRTGDFDGDGHADILLLGLDAGISVLAGDGTGALADPVFTALAEPAHEGAVGDFDADGVTDVFVSVAGAPPRVELFEGLGDGTFELRAAFDSNYTTVGTDLSVGDFDGDGDLDAASLHQGLGDLVGKHVGSFTNQGGGTWSFIEQQFQILKSDIKFDSAPGIMLPVNVAGDHPDLLAADHRSIAHFYRLRTDGQGGFFAAEKIVSLPMAHHAVAYDLEGDGVDEIAGAFRHDLNPALFKKTGDAWSPLSDDSVPDWARGAALGEVIRDPRPDIVVMWDTQGLIGAAAINPDGTLDTVYYLGLGAGYSTFALADLNEDGNSDFVLVTPGGVVRLMLSE